MNGLESQKSFVGVQRQQSGDLLILSLDIFSCRHRKNLKIKLKTLNGLCPASVLCFKCRSLLWYMNNMNEREFIQLWFLIHVQINAPVYHCAMGPRHMTSFSWGTDLSHNPIWPMSYKLQCRVQTGIISNVLRSQWILPKLLWTKWVDLWEREPNLINKPGKNDLISFFKSFTKIKDVLFFLLSEEPCLVKCLELKEKKVWKISSGSRNIIKMEVNLHSLHLS